MTKDADVTHPWDGDVNEAVVEEWKDETTAFERIVSVIDVTTEPAFASEIAERAAVSEPTVRKHLQSLASVGRVDTLDASRGVQYRRSPSMLAMRRISVLHDQYSKEELQQGIVDLRKKIQTLREKYGANDPDDLATTLAADSDGWTDVSRWRSLEENLDIAKAALSLYDFDPDGSNSSTVDAERDGRTMGGLATFDTGTSA